MDFTMLIRSAGYIFGPLMLLCGLAAVVACVRATRRGDRPSARRAAGWSLSPIAAGLVGVVYGLIYWVSLGMPGNRASGFVALGYTVLFGVFVAAVPLLWSAALLR